ncbi:MAG: hypothetical protein NTW96_04710 [Planctomycetia bacterium]|nr:hypothetical protein [Planctomycetia bacterium]
MNAKRTYADKIVKNLRWRFDLGSPGKAFPTAPDFLWSEDGKSWTTVPRTMYGHPEVRRDIIATALGTEVISDILSDERSEPIAHGLFRDAWAQRHRDIKAALTQGVSALEVAVKHCIVQLVPDAEYLILEMPSPPVVTLLRDYLPRLLASRHSAVPAISPSYLKLVSNMVHQRNLLIHKGELTVDGEKVTEYLELIHDLLYFLDFVSGNEWALKLTSKEFKAWLNQELPGIDLADPLAIASNADSSDAS